MLYPDINDSGDETGIPPSAGSAEPTGMNDQGQIVGSFYARDAGSDALPLGGFLHGGGVTIDLNTLPEVIARGIRINRAVAINNSGQILVDVLSAPVLKYYVLSPQR